MKDNVPVCVDDRCFSSWSKTPTPAAIEAVTPPPGWREEAERLVYRKERMALPGRPEKKK